MKKTISGIRGVFGDHDLTLKEIIKYTNNFAQNLVESKRCVIAKDTRASSTIIEDVVSATLLQNGVDVFSLGMAPTPVAFRESRRYGSGLIVSSSHNPLQTNGLKFIIRGRGINEKELSTITATTTTTTIQNTKTTNVVLGEQNQIISNYIQDAATKIQQITTNNKKPNVIIDIGGGAAVNTVPTLLEKIGCNIKVINPTIKNSTRGPDPTSDNLNDLKKHSKNYDIGFAFDLDGDRLVIVKDGVKQTPDVTLGLGIAKCIEQGMRKFVFSIDTSVSIEKFAKVKGCQVIRTKVGEANVIESILNTKSDAGGEGSSGGFILPEFNYCRDGILASGLIASMLDDSQFKEILEFMQRYHQIRDKMEIDTTYHDKILKALTEHLQSQFSDVSTVDGIKVVIDEDTWILIRKSNTENIIRVSGESDNKEKIENIIKDTKQLVNKCYEKVR